MFVLNILLALIWAAVMGAFSLVNLAAGFALGFLILWLTQRARAPSLYFARVRRVLGFAVFFIWELILANLRVAYDVVTPTHHMRPGVIRIPLEARTDAEITLLANLITLTPGTLSLDVTPDRQALFIHAMYIDGDVDALRAKIKSGFERRVVEVLR